MKFQVFKYLILFSTLLFGIQAEAQIEAIGQCTGVTTDQNYNINVTGLPSGAHTIYLDGTIATSAATGSYVSNDIAFVDGTAYVEVKIVENGETDTTTILVHEVLCTDVNGDGTSDFNTQVCDYTKPLGSGGAIVSTVAPYTGDNVYAYVLVGEDSIYDSASAVVNNSGLFEDLSNGGYIVFAYNFLSITEANTFIDSIPDATNLATYVPGGGPTCFALCGDASYTIDCESIVDIYVNPSDVEVCMEGDATFYIQDSIIAPVPDLADLSYEWYEINTLGDTTALSAETDSVLDLTNVVFADSGNMYFVIVTMTVGVTEISMDTSGVATLTVYEDPILASTLDVTINSADTTGIVFTTTGGAPADSFDIVSITFGGLTPDGGNATTGITTDTSAISNDSYTNDTGGPDTAYYVVVPISVNGCAGDTVTISVIVLPCPELEDLASVELCSGDQTGITLPSTDDNGATIDSFAITTTYQGVTGTATTGTITDLSAISLDTFANTTDLVDSVVYSIIAYANNCESSPFTVVANYKPEPIYADTSYTQCSDVAIGVDIAFTDDSGLAIDSVDITSSTSGATTGTGITSVSAISSDVFTNTGETDITVVYTVTPYAMGCTGDSYTITVTISSEPVGTDPTPTVCSDELISIDLSTLITNGGTSPSFTWSAAENSNVTGEDTTSQSSNTLNDQLTNTTNTDQTVVYTVIPTNGESCIGDAFTVTVTVNPEPTSDDMMLEVCSDEALDINLSDSLTNTVAVAGYTYYVTSTDSTNVPPGSSRTDTLAANITDTYENITNATVIITYTVTPISTSGCAGDEFDVDVSVKPEPVLSASLDTTVCSDSPIGVILAVELSSVAADSFEIVSIDSNGLVSSAGIPSLVTTSDINEISDHAWTNETSDSVNVIYTIAPWTDGCRGDEVDVTVTIDPAPVVEVDENATVCSTESVDLTAIGASITGGTTSGTWSSSGTGTFDDTAFGTGTSYTPSEADKDAGVITLTLTSSDPSGVCSTDSDSIEVEILDIRCSEFPWSGND